MRLTATRTSVTSSGSSGTPSVPSFTLNLNFAESKSLTDSVSGNNLTTFSRASSGTYVGSDGLIKTAVADAPRFDHDPVTGESLGLLIEESRTNLAKYSEPDDRSTNSFSGEWSFVDLDPNTEITKVEGPDGVSNSASEMQLATGNSVDTYLFHAPVTPGASYTFSAWVKLGTATNFALHVNNTLANDSIPDGTYSFDVNDGLNTNTFVKVSHTFTAPSNGKVNVHIGRHGGTAPVQQTQGTVTVWGCQLELGAFSSSTIITTGSTVTRSPDIATIEGTNFSSWYNATAGTFYVQENSFNNALDKYYIFISDGSNNDRLWVSKDSVNRHIFRVYDSTNTLQVASASPILLSTSETVSSKFVGAYFSGDSNSALNGSINVDLTNNAFVRSGSNNAYLGSHPSSTGFLNGHISRLAYFPTRKTDQELIKITDGTLAPAIITYGITNAGGTFNLLSTGTVDYAVDWDSTGGYEESTLNTLQHTYAAGNYDLVVYSDGVYRPFFDGSGDEDQLTSVAIGAGADLGTNLDRAWFGANNMTSFVCPFDVTSSVTSFSNAWRNCSGLTSFPLINTSNGTNFNVSWDGCSGLTSFPLLNTSSGANFSFAWRNCSGLTSFPAIDAGNGTNFSYAWRGCGGLTSFPAIDAGNGTNFTETWDGCSGLANFPLIDTSTGTNFQATWRGCGGLTSFPLLDTSSGIDFSNTWRNCTSLTSFPLLNTSSGTSFSETWRGCNSLTNFPLLNTSSGTSFDRAWQNCSSLTSFPLIDTSSGTTFTAAWFYCTSLADFPANMFDTTGTLISSAFTNAWLNCALTAQSIENILVSLDTNGATGITLSIDGGTNAAKTTWSAAAVTAYDNLTGITKGWTINFNA